MENKTRKYLKYAIGEIVLVVIGILIALQINNWNSQRIENQNTLRLYKGLLNETKSNIANLKNDITNVEKSKSSSIELLQMKDTNYEHLDKRKVDSLFLNIYVVTSYDFNSAILDIALTTNEITNVQNDSTEIVMHRVKFLVGEIKSTEDIITHHLDGNLSLFWKDKISIRNMDYKFSENGNIIGKSKQNIDNRAILTSLVFENLIDDLYYLNLSLGKTYNNLNETLITLSKLLEKKISE